MASLGRILPNPPDLQGVDWYTHGAQMIGCEEAELRHIGID